MINKAFTVTDLLTTSIKSSQVVNTTRIDEQSAISNIVKLLGLGADIICLNLINDTVIIKGSKDGMFIFPTFIASASETFNIRKLSGLSFSFNNSVTSIVSDTTVLVVSNETGVLIRDSVESEKVLMSSVGTSSGVIFVTSKSDMHSLVALKSLTARATGSHMYVSYSQTGWKCVNDENQVTVPDEESVVSLVNAMSIRNISIISTNNDLAIRISSKLASCGVLVYVSTVGQSSVHMFCKIMSHLSCSEISQVLIGVIGLVEVPIFDTSQSKKIRFLDSDLYGIYNKYDASPMPDDIIPIVSNDLAPYSSVVLTDFIACPKNPSVLKNEIYTVMDVYSSLKMEKWDSALDKSMPFIKNLNTGLNVIDKYIGKF